MKLLWGQLTYGGSFLVPHIRVIKAISFDSSRTIVHILAVPALAAVMIAALMLGTPSRAEAVQSPVDLGTAESFSVLGGQTVTNTGPTILSGDLGVNPGTSITGFPPGVALGSTHSADAVAIQAQSDVVIAYNDIAGRAPTENIAGDLVGETLVDGVYKSTGPISLSGTLVLDGQGDPNSVFIFQVAGTLITSTASTVALTNGARACNVFWQVAESATLGTASVFTGSILALASVTVTTNTVVRGRALARTAGAVTLDSNSFTTTACDVIATPTPTASASSGVPTRTPRRPTTSATPSNSGSPSDSGSPSVSGSASDSASASDSPSPTGLEPTADDDYDDDDDDDDNDDNDDDNDNNDDDDDNDDTGSGGQDGRASDLADTGATSLAGPLAGIGSALVILGSGALILGRRKTTYRPKHL